MLQDRCHFLAAISLNASLLYDRYYLENSSEKSYTICFIKVNEISDQTSDVVIFHYDLSLTSYLFFL